MYKTFTGVLLGCLTLVSVQAQNSQRKAIVAPEQLVSLNHITVQEPNESAGAFARNVVSTAVNRAPSTNPGVASVNPIALGSAANVLTIIYQESNQVIADDSTGLVMFVHRNNPSIWGGSSGNLRYDVSTDGGATFSDDIGVVNPIQSLPARYPQIAIYNAPGNTNPLAAHAVITAPTLATNFDGHVNCFSDVVTSGTPISTENYQFQGTGSNIPSSLCERVSGEYWMVEQTSAGNGDLFIYKGVYNGSDIIWNRVDTISPNYNLSFSGTPQSISSQISFSPDGQTGWIAFLGDLIGGPDSTFQPCFIKSSDGGQTWAAATEYNLNSTSWVTDSLQSLWTDSLGNPASTGRSTTSFECDLTVDINGNPHLAAVVGSSPPNPYYALSPGLAKFLADVTSPDGGVTWTTKYISPVLTLRTPVFGATATTVFMDNNVQIARSTNGEEIFFSWADSDTAVFTGNQNGIGFGVSDNLAPNLRIAALRVADGFQTYPQLITDGDLIWDGRALFPTMAPIVLGSGYMWNLPIVMAEMPALEPADPTNFYYFGNDADICTFWFENPASMNLGWPAIVAHSNAPCFLEVNNSETQSVTMSDVFPNPATDKAEIRFTLPASGETRIEVINIYGQVVEVIANETLSAGSHSSTVNSSELAEGAYLCNLYFGNQMITKKFVVAK